jgi:sulfur carrier protein
MRVTVDVLGEGVEEVDIDGGTYADLLAAVDLSPNEASVLVDGRPVPEDEPIDEPAVTVLRLVKGG